MTKRTHSLSRQRGVAVVTALLLTTLAITIVASLFWQQQVQVRSIENQRLQLQKQWILRGALDWARLILREDGRGLPNDNLTEPWAVPLEETRLDQYVENGRADADASDAAISGSIVDAQSRFNLRNLCRDGAINERQIAIFAQLLSNLNLKPALAQATADMMATAQKKAADTTADAPQPMDIGQAEDLLAVPGFTPEIFDKLRDFVVVLPVNAVTKINVNTASPEVLSATVATLSLSSATAVAAGRNQSYFRSLGEFEMRAGVHGSNDAADIKTSYFIVNGNVRLNRASLQVHALIERIGNEPPKVIWIREE